MNIKKVAIVNKSYTEPSQVWIQRHVEALLRYVPVVVANNVTINTKLYKIITTGRNSIVKKILGRVSFRLLKNYDNQSTWFDWYLFTSGIKSARANLVHFHFFWNAILFFDHKAKLNIPLIVTAHGTDVNAARVDDRYRKRLVDVARRLDLIVCVSDFIKNTLLSFGCPEKKLVVNHLGVPIDRFKAKLHNPTNNNIRFICVSALREEKGLDLLISSFEKVCHTIKNCNLTIVGDGPLRPKLDSLIKQLQLDNVVKITGWAHQYEVADLMFSSDIYVQHSIVYERFGRYPVIKEEGLPVSLVEAAASGLPIISTRVGGIPEICIDGVNGYIVDPLNINYMAEKMINMAQNYSLRSHMGLAGRQLVEKYHDERVQIEKLERIYDCVLEESIKNLY